MRKLSPKRLVTCQKSQRKSEAGIGLKPRLSFPGGGTLSTEITTYLLTHHFSLDSQNKDSSTLIVEYLLFQTQGSLAKKDPQVFRVSLDRWGWPMNPWHYMQISVSEVKGLWIKAFPLQKGRKWVRHCRWSLGPCAHFRAWDSKTLMQLV